MRGSHAQVAMGIIALLFAAAACTAAATPAADLAPTPSSSPAAASPTAAPTPASPGPSATAEPAPEPTRAPLPPKPTGVKFDQQRRASADGQVEWVTQTVRWVAPRSEGVDIRVYGVTECIAEPADPLPGTSGPCLVRHTPLPASVRTLLATAPASDGVVRWAWTQGWRDCDRRYPAWDPDGTRYYAVVLAACSEADHSIFAIAEPGGWWRPAPGGLGYVGC